jgi:hypothetical protein
MSNRPGEQSSPNLEQLLRMGITAAKAGNIENARVFFQRVLESNQNEERAWIWLAWTADNDVDRRRYLETALTLNPNSRKIKQYLADMENQKSSGENRTLIRGMIILGILVGLTILVIIVALILSRPG